MALAEQLGDGRWYAQLAAIWHWSLPLCIYRNMFIFSVHSFLYFSLIWY